MAKFTNEPILSDYYSKALATVTQIHRFQVRHDLRTPYLSHLMSVSSLILKMGGSESEAIAGLLHDAIEDVDLSIEWICNEFGYEVANIVMNVTENKSLMKKERKESYIQLIRCGSDSTKVVSFCDKLDNIRDYYGFSQHLWTEETSWFYKQLIAIYDRCDRIPQPWINEMQFYIEQLGF